MTAAGKLRIAGAPWEPPDRLALSTETPPGTSSYIGLAARLNLTHTNIDALHTHTPRYMYTFLFKRAMKELNLTHPHTHPTSQPPFLLLRVFSSHVHTTFPTAPAQLSTKCHKTT